MEKEAYDSPTDLQVALSNGIPSWLQIAGTMIRRRFPKFPDLKNHKNAENHEDFTQHILETRKKTYN